MSRKRDAALAALVERARAAGFRVSQDGSVVVVRSPEGVSAHGADDTQPDTAPDGFYYYPDGSAFRLGVDLACATRLRLDAIAGLIARFEQSEPRQSEPGSDK